MFAIGQGVDGGISAYTNDGAAIANGLKFTSVTANDGTAGSLSAVDVDGDRKPEFVFAVQGDAFVYDAADSDAQHDRQFALRRE